MMAAALSEEQFRCSICLDIFRNPVSIPCGHNFCLGCIKRFWDTRHKSECPLCKETFKNRPDLRVNVGLKDITEHFNRSLRGCPTVKPPPRRRRIPRQVSKSDDVFCDTCIKEDAGHQTPAAKSCLACRESYCEEHLVPHLQDPVMTKHTLTDPGTFAISHMCKKHGLLLEKFCQRDQQLVCPRCTDREHKHHEVVSIDKESRRIRSEMKKAQADSQQMIQARMQKRKEIKDALDLSKRTKEKNIEKSVQVYSSVIAAIQRHQAVLLEDSEQKQEEIEKRAEQLLKDLNQEVNEIQRRRSEIHQLESTDDPLHLIQSYSSVTVPSFTNDPSKMKVHMTSSIHTMRTAFSKVVDVCLELQQQLAIEEVNMMTQYAVDITLDPLTAAGWLDLSANGKKVSVNVHNRCSVHEDPKRFDSCVAVLGKQSFSTSRHYWVVLVGDKTDWDLGIAKESINRKGAINVRPDCGFWAICRRKGGCLSACTSPSVPLPLKETPHKIGIFLDYEEGEVSFFDAEAKVHIYTFSEFGFNEPLYPYFNPCLRDNGKNAGPLVISSVEAVITAGNVTD